MKEMTPELMHTIGYERRDADSWPKYLLVEVDESAAEYVISIHEAGKDDLILLRIDDLANINPAFIESMKPLDAFEVGKLVQKYASPADDAARLARLLPCSG